MYKAQQTAPAHHYHNPLTLVRSDPRAVSALRFSSLCLDLGVLAVSRKGLAWVVGQEPLHVSALRNHGHLHGSAISTPRIASIAPLMLCSRMAQWPHSITALSCVYITSPVMSPTHTQGQSQRKSRTPESWSKVGKGQTSNMLTRGHPFTYYLNIPGSAQSVARSRRDVLQRCLSQARRRWKSIRVVYGSGLPFTVQEISVIVK